jgi:Ni/Co efflux regulator RcnB
MRKFITALAASALALTTIVPTQAFADHRRDGYYDHRDYDRHDRRRGRHHHDDDNDAAVAGVVGLVLGIAVAAAVTDASRQRDNRVQCYDNYQRCAPPQGYGDGAYYEGDYGDDRYYDDGGRCVRTERGYDRQTGRYVTVEVPC